MTVARFQAAPGALIDTTYTVPDGCTIMRYEAQGSRGGGPNGGRAGHARGYMTVTPGQVLGIQVFPQPTNDVATGYYAGAGGTGPAGNGFAGGDPAVIFDVASNLIMVAGAGGGGQGGTSTAQGGPCATDALLGNLAQSVAGANGSGSPVGDGANTGSAGGASGTGAAGSGVTGGAGGSSVTSGHYGGGGGGGGNWGGGGGGSGTTSGGGGGGTTRHTNTVFAHEWSRRATGTYTQAEPFSHHGFVVLEPIFQPALQLSATAFDDPDTPGSSIYELDSRGGAGQKTDTVIEFAALGNVSSIIFQPATTQTAQGTLSTSNDAGKGWRDLMFIPAKAYQYRDSRWRISTKIKAEAIAIATMPVVRLTAQIWLMTGGSSFAQRKLMGTVSGASVAIADGGTTTFTVDFLFPEDYRSLENEVLQIEFALATLDNGSPAPPDGSVRYRLLYDGTSSARDTVLYQPPTNLLVLAQANLTAQATLSASGQLIKPGSAVLAAEGTLSTAPKVSTTGAVTMGATSTLGGAATTQAPVLATATLAAESSMAPIEAFAGVIVPVGATPAKYLRNSKTPPNGQFLTVFDLLNNDAAETPSTARFTGLAGSSSIQFSPHAITSLQELAFSSPPTTAKAWADLTQHGAAFDTTYLAGNWITSFRLRKRNQALSADVRVRGYVRYSRVELDGSRTSLLTVTSNVGTIASSNTLSFQFTNSMPETAFPAGTRLQVEFWVATVDASGNVSPPSAGVDIELDANIATSLQLPDNRSWGHAPRVGGVSEMVAEASLITVSSVTARAVAFLDQPAELTVATTATAVSVAALTADAVLTAPDLVTALAAVALASDTTLTGDYELIRAAIAELVSDSELLTTADVPQLGAASLEATSILEAEAFRGVLAAVELVQEAFLTGGADLLITAAVELVSDTSLSVEATRILVGAAALDAQAVLTAAGVALATSAAQLVADSTLTTVDLVVVVADAFLDQDSVLTVASTGVVFAAAGLVADSELFTPGFLLTTGAAAMAAESAFFAEGTRGVLGSAFIQAESAMTAAGMPTVLAAVILAADSALVGAVFLSRFGAADLVADSTLSVLTRVTTFGLVAMSVDAALSVGELVTVPAVVFMLGQADLEPDGRVTSFHLAQMQADTTLTTGELVVAVSAVLMEAQAIIRADVVTVTLQALSELYAEFVPTEFGEGFLVADSELVIAEIVQTFTAAALFAEATMLGEGMASAFASTSLSASAVLSTAAVLLIRQAAALRAVAALSTSVRVDVDATTALLAESLLISIAASTVEAAILLEALATLTGEGMPSKLGFADLAATAALTAGLVLAIARARVAMEGLSQLGFAMKPAEIINYWDGAAYALAEVFQWTGASWRSTEPFLHWNGAAWETVT